MREEKDSLGREFLLNEVLCGINTIRSSDNFPSLFEISDSEFLYTFLLQVQAKYDKSDIREIINTDILENCHLAFNETLVRESKAEKTTLSGKIIRHNILQNRELNNKDLKEKGMDIKYAA